MHGMHTGEVPDSLEGCYNCHPGPETQCLRDVMGQRGMDCVDCHGTMREVAENPNPWLNGSITTGVVLDARVVRYVEKADRCGDNPGYLLEIVPGGYAMLCADGVSLKEGQTRRVSVQQCNSARRSVVLALVDDDGE
jgi:hypothetical protein